MSAGIGPTILILERVHQDCSRILLECGYRVLNSWELEPDQLSQAYGDAQAIVIKSATQVNRQFLSAFSKLEFIARAGTGTDNIDLTAVQEAGIQLTTTPGMNAEATAEFAMAQILAEIKSLSMISASVGRGDFRRHKLYGEQVSLKRIGLAGIGEVGRRMIERLRSFGCEILLYDRPEKLQTLEQEFGLETTSDLNYLFRSCDVVSLHLRADSSNYAIINKRVLNAIQSKGFILLNTARASLIDEVALEEALKNGSIRRYICDHVDPEPDYEAANLSAKEWPRLLHSERVVFSPHVAALTDHTQVQIAVELANQVDRYICLAKKTAL
ncbi:MAG: D-isomer specific 2-hydroxyacid dehydrogenase family protein [Rhizobiaceae bacterium]